MCLSREPALFYLLIPPFLSTITLSENPFALFLGSGGAFLQELPGHGAASLSSRSHGSGDVSAKPRVHLGSSLEVRVRPRRSAVAQKSQRRKPREQLLYVHGCAFS